MEAKTFDCVAMNRAAAIGIYEETKHMSAEEKREYWRQRNEEFLRAQRQRKADSRAGSV